jgi:hypothetical protein
MSEEGNSLFSSLGKCYENANLKTARMRNRLSDAENCGHFFAKVRVEHEVPVYVRMVDRAYVVCLQIAALLWVPSES